MNLTPTLLTNERRTIDQPTKRPTNQNQPTAAAPRNDTGNPVWDECHEGSDEEIGRGRTPRGIGRSLDGGECYNGPPGAKRLSVGFHLRLFLSCAFPQTGHNTLIPSVTLLCTCSPSQPGQSLFVFTVVITFSLQAFFPVLKSFPH